MHILEHLFLVGEFPARAHLLSGLTLEQVTLCPDGASHSIYEELWHVVAYQQSVIEPGGPAGDVYPSAAPKHEHQWHDVVRVFLDGARAAAALGQAPERLALEVTPGVTMADELNERVLAFVEKRRLPVGWAGSLRGGTDHSQQGAFDGQGTRDAGGAEA